MTGSPAGSLDSRVGEMKGEDLGQAGFLGRNPYFWLLKQVFEMECEELIVADKNTSLKSSSIVVKMYVTTNSPANC